MPFLLNCFPSCSSTLFSFPVSSFSPSLSQQTGLTKDSTIQTELHGTSKVKWLVCWLMVVLLVTQKCKTACLKAILLLVAVISRVELPYSSVLLLNMKIKILMRHFVTEWLLATVCNMIFPFKEIIELRDR